MEFNNRYSSVFVTAKAHPLPAYTVDEEAAAE